ncbi:MAG: hypothetical protein AB1762_08595, partial [Gemmatimonadota bacterium]
MRPAATITVLTTVALFTSCVSIQKAASTADADLAIARVTIVDVERGRLLRDQSILVKGDRIVAVASSSAGLPGNARVVDGSGKYVIPGLWDMHAHIGATANPLLLEMPLFTAHGVTGIRVMGAPRDLPTFARLRQLQTATASGGLIGPRILLLSSWAVNGESGITDSMPAYWKARTREEGAELARYLKQSGYDFIKIYNNLSREGYLGLTAEARRLNLPFAGHEPSSLSAIELSNAGQKSLEHSRIFLFNCFPGADSLQKRLLPFA